jgi:hypothetical protein
MEIAAETIARIVSFVGNTNEKNGKDNAREPSGVAAAN